MIFEFQSKKIYYEFINKSSEKTVVLLHGWGGDHKSLMPLLPSFNDYNVLTLDFFGFGKSDLVNENYNLYSYSDAVISLIKALNLKNLTLVGHSFGGRVAIVIASECRELVEAVILIDSAGILPKRSIKKTMKTCRFKMNKFFVKLGLVKKEKLLKYYSSDYQKLSDAERIVFKRIINEDLSKYLEFITQKTLIIWGEKDKDTPMYMAKKLNKGIKNSKLIIVKNGSHFAYLEHTNIIVNAIKEFLK